MATPSPRRTPAADKATPIDDSKSRTRRAHSQKDRRERRREAKRSKNDTPVASGSATPYAKPSSDNDGGELKILGASGSSMTTNNSNGKSNGNGKESTFAEGDDFIPFSFSDSSEDEAGPSHRSSDRKGKGKEAERKRDNTNDTGSEIVADNSLGKVVERLKAEKERDDTRSKVRTSEREWDRGKSERRDRRDDREPSRKRKHEDYDDGYANKKERLDAASRKCPWVNGLDLERCRNVAEMMHKEVESFVDWISPTPVEDEVRGLIVTHISKVVKSAFPDAKVYPFGSYQTKLYLPLGDIDLVVLSDAMAYSDKSTVLHVLANTLKRSGITSYVTIIAKAKVPIVKFVTTHGRFKVDISINQGNGLVSGDIITGFLKDMIPSAEGRESKALRSLVMVTKAFLSQRSMNEVYTGGLGSYAIMHPKIRTGEINPEKNLGVLVMEFFELYGNHFNYDEVGISVREGGTYFNKRQRGWHAEYKRNMLSIEDPADSSNDISSGSYNFFKVRAAFSGCHSMLTTTAYLRAGILNSRRHGQSVHLRDRYEPEDLTILSMVMGITQETINHRRLVQELYDKQVLHRVTGVKPLPTVVTANGGQKAAPSSSSARASHEVKSAWNDRDVDRDSDYEDGYRSRHHQLADDEGGRYDIGRQPPKKRRKTGRSEDAHAVYFEDDEEDTDGARREDAEYMSDESEDEERSIRDGVPRDGVPRNDNKRSYWLSKRSGIDADPEDDGH
ncbi:hypothetical protein BDN70DRAFT_906733 [Pholiota conissans]|uniref:polynucleotide adenylyltransferase n=1 Tax=Pholiota conissans TaxID=109636 RepID=A0A9P5YZM3_9AGAR|nr:hypothetical protein BDN70DRAFT_906733 [Pholiota conissans]